MKCPNCGTDIPDDSKFCNECGTAIEAKHVEKSDAQQPSANSDATKAASPTLADGDKGNSQKKAHKKKEGKKSRGRTIAIVVIVIFVLMIAAGAAQGNKSDSSSSTTTQATPASSSSSSSSETNATSSSAAKASSGSSSSAASTSSASTTKKSFAQTLSSFDFDEQTVSGSGDDVVTIPTSFPCVMDITNSGSSNFAVWTLDSSGNSVDLLINEIGSYDGTVTDYLHYTNASSLEVKSSGSWTITFRPLSSIEPATNGGTYSGDGVVLIDESSISKVHFSNSGSSNFVVHAIGTKTAKLLVNEIGDYDGTVVWNNPQAFFIVNSSGDWTISW